MTGRGRMISGLILIPFMAISLFEGHRIIGSMLRFSYDAFDRLSYMPLALSLVAGTLSSAAISTIAARATTWLFGRYAIIAAFVVMFPILHLHWPWNSVFHDYRWTTLDWVISGYEFITLVLMLLLMLFVASRRLLRPNKAPQAA